MKKKYIIILLLTLFLIPLKVFAVGGFDVSPTSISLYPGESKTITISSSNAVGKLNISSTDTSIARVSSASLFIQNPNGTETIQVVGNSVGTATINVVASAEFATMDEEILEGVTKTITVNVLAKPTPSASPSPSVVPSPSPSINPSPSPSVNPSPSPSASPSPSQQPSGNLSTNANLINLSIDGYELVKVDNNTFTLMVSNDVTSINLNATAEDSKAKVSGAGTKKLSSGENKFEVVVTAEAGNQNKYIIKVTRKDGFYLEDFNTIINNKSLHDTNIIINSDSKITKEQVEQIKNNKKVLKFNYYDSRKKLLYSWKLNGNAIVDSSEFITSIDFVSDNLKKMYELSERDDGLPVNFKHSGPLPIGTKIKIHVGDKFDNGTVVNVYYYNSAEVKLDLFKENLKVVEEYIEFDIEHCSEYFITTSLNEDYPSDEVVEEEALNNTENEKPTLSLPMIIIIVGVVAVLLIAIIILAKGKSKKSE